VDSLDDVIVGDKEAVVGVEEDEAAAWVFESSKMRGGRGGGREIVREERGVEINW